MSDPTRTGAWAGIEESVGEVRIEVAPTVLGADAAFVSSPARYAGIVSEVAYYPRAGIAATDTNTRQLTVFNRGTNGAGTKQVADKTYNVAGGALLSKRKNVITLTAVAGDKAVAVGEVFELISTHLGTGLADPGGVLIIKIDRS